MILTISSGTPRTTTQVDRNIERLGACGPSLDAVWLVQVLLLPTDLPSLESETVYTTKRYACDKCAPTLLQMTIYCIIEAFAKHPDVCSPIYAEANNRLIICASLIATSIQVRATIPFRRLDAKITLSGRVNTVVRPAQLAQPSILSLESPSPTANWWQ